MDDQHHASDYSEHEEEARRNAAWQHYLDQLNAVFLSMNNGMLMDAGRGLLDVSRWLLLNVNDLGMFSLIEVWNETSKLTIMIDRISP